MFVFSPPHSPLSVVTTIVPTRLHRLAASKERVPILGIRLRDVHRDLSALSA